MEAYRQSNIQGKIIAYDDGSTDMATEIAEVLRAIIIRYGSNLDYGVALASLFKKAREPETNVALTIDVYDQHNLGRYTGTRSSYTKGRYRHSHKK